MVKQGSGEVIDGPYKCEWELFDKFNAFEPSNDDMPMIVPNESALALSTIKKARYFSYNEEQLKKKYEDLTGRFCHGKIGLTYDDFHGFIKEPYAYSVNKIELIETISSRDNR